MLDDDDDFFDDLLIRTIDNIDNGWLIKLFIYHLKVFRQFYILAQLQLCFAYRPLTNPIKVICDSFQKHQNLVGLYVLTVKAKIRRAMYFPMMDLLRTWTLNFCPTKIIFIPTMYSVSKYPTVHCPIHIS